MTLRTGRRTSGRAFRRSAFTLIELILVMTLLAVVMAVSAPSLSHFFRGRTLDSEARRFLSLTRYAENRAVSEGVPMMLWMNAEEGTYGLEQEPGYTDEDPKAVEFALGEDLQFDFLDSAALGSAGSKEVTIRFLPDGSISEASPQEIWIREGEVDSVWITQSRSRLHYEIQDPNQIQQNAFR